MPVKSFFGEIEEGARHFYATVLRGEVSDANVQGFLRASSQIEDLWQEIDSQVAVSIGQGVAPWEAYQRLGYPLAYIRAARTYQVFVRELLAADAAADPGLAGYLPRVTFDQANALCHHIQPLLEHAVAAFHDPAYVPVKPLPLHLGPRLEAEGHACPLPHLQGIIAAAREVREWAAGLIAEYENAIRQSTVPAPAEITTHLTALQGRLAQADSQLRFGVDLVGQISRGGATTELHERAEDRLWKAMEQVFLLNQATAMPALLRAAPGPKAPKPGTSARSYHDQRIRPNDLWRIAAPSARAELRGTEFGRDEMEEMCEKMGGILSAGAQQYLDEVEAAVEQGRAHRIAAMSNCPFEPVYRARVPLNLAGAHVPAGHEFHWDFHRGHIESSPRFGRAPTWKECEE
jgi:hypothetical protein